MKINKIKIKRWGSLKFGADFISHNGFYFEISLGRVTYIFWIES